MAGLAAGVASTVARGEHHRGRDQRAGAAEPAFLGGESDDTDVGVDLIALPAGDRPGRQRGDHRADDKQQTGQQPTPKTDPKSPHRVTPPQQ